MKMKMDIKDHSRIVDRCLPGRVLRMWKAEPYSKVHVYIINYNVNYIIPSGNQLLYSYRPLLLVVA